MKKDLDSGNSTGSHLIEWTTSNEGHTTRFGSPEARTRQLLKNQHPQVSGGGGSDWFRLKIWDDLSGGVIFDNQVSGEPGDNATPPTIIGGGSIVIHHD